MDLASNVNENQIRKFAEISERLHGLARGVSSLSEVQPDYAERLREVRHDLKSIVYRLRGIN